MHHHTGWRSEQPSPSLRVALPPPAFFLGRADRLPPPMPPLSGSGQRRLAFDCRPATRVRGPGMAGGAKAGRCAQRLPRARLCRGGAPARLDRRQRDCTCLTGKSQRNSGFTSCRTGADGQPNLVPGFASSRCSPARVMECVGDHVLQTGRAARTRQMRTGSAVSGHGCVPAWGRSGVNQGVGDAGSLRGGRSLVRSGHSPQD